MNEYDEQTEKIKTRMSLIGRKIAIMSGKGGVGKTTVTVNLARSLSRMGKKVGILDTDVHGPNVALMMGLEGEEVLSNDGKTMLPVKSKEGILVMSLSFVIPSSSDAIIWRGAMKNSVIRQFLADTEWGELDYLLFDTPPGTGDEALSIVQSVSDLTGVIVVTTPQEVAILDSRKSLDFAEKTNSPIIGVIENMSGLICPNCKCVIPIFGKGGGEKIAKEKGVNFLGSIPMEIEMEEAEDNGSELSSSFPSRAEIDKIATLLEEGDVCTTKRKINYKDSEKCSPEMCEHCSSGCKKTNSK